MPTNAEATAADRAHVFHSWSAQDLVAPMPVAGGLGAVFWDDEGREYLDFSSQLVNLNLGHQHPRMVQAICDQAQRLCTIGPTFANDVRSRRRLSSRSTHHPVSTRCSSPTGGPRPSRTRSVWPRCTPDATRCSRRIAATTERPPPRSRQRASRAAGRANRRSAGRFTSSGRTSTAPRSAATTEEQECTRALEHLESVVELEGPDTIAAVIAGDGRGNQRCPGATRGVPGRGARAVRSAWDRDDLRRGDGRIRSPRGVVRR